MPLAQRRTTSATGAELPDSLSAALERDRLEARVRRATIALTALRDAASAYRRESSGPPQQLRRALADFEAQINDMRARADALRPSSPQNRMRDESR